MNEELDLEKFVELFDAAMSSDNPTVKKCFNNLLMVVAFAHSGDEKVKNGPLTKLVTDVNALKGQYEAISAELRLLRMQMQPNTPQFPAFPYQTYTTTGASGTSGYCYDPSIIPYHTGTMQ